jgi:hypothetical protein
MKSTRLIMMMGMGLLAAQAGCVHASGSYYASAEGAPAAYQQPATATYAVPPNDPKGTVYIVSMGGEQLPVGNGSSGLFLHVRIAAENKSDAAPWRFDPNEQSLRLEDGTPEPASFAQATGGGPVLTLPPGQRGQLDLYYPLPSENGPPRTTFAWQVRRGDQPLAYATVFERPAVAAAPGAPAYYAPAYDARVHFAFGPGWWWGYDYWPFYYGFYAPFYRPWLYRPWYGPRYYGHGFYAPHRYYHPAPSVGRGRGYAPGAPSTHVGRSGFRRR